MNKDDIYKGNRSLRIVYWLSNVVIVLVCAIYFMYSVQYSPSTRIVLLTHLDSVYRNEDLTETNVSEGEIKQFVYESLRKTFTYDFLSFSNNETYEKLINGELHTDLPDHRDFIRPLFNDVAHGKIISELIEAPWMFRFSEERRRTTFSMSMPASTRGDGARREVIDGRLTQRLNGHFFLISQGYNRRSVRYRINYQITLERRPNATRQEARGYFFRPMVEDNIFEWRISELNWRAERVN